MTKAKASMTEIKKQDAVKRIPLTQHPTLIQVMTMNKKIAEQLPKLHDVKKDLPLCTAIGLIHETDMVVLRHDNCHLYTISMIWYVPALYSLKGLTDEEVRQLSTDDYNNVREALPQLFRT